MENMKCPVCNKILGNAPGIGSVCNTRNCPVCDDAYLWTSKASLRASTISKWKKCEIRKCLKFKSATHICKLCKRQISYTEKYYDGGHCNRVHINCVVERV